MGLTPGDVIYALPPSSGMDDPGWVFPVVITGAILAAIIIAFVMLRKR